MNRNEFQELILPALKEKGYKPVGNINGEPYNGKDIFYCPQAPNLFLLTILPSITRIEKIGNDGYQAKCQTQVKSPEDINKLHKELNKVILDCDESSLIGKHSGCLGVLFLLIIFSISIKFI